MQVQISNIINRIKKHNKIGYIYCFNVRRLEYVINYSFIRILRDLHNLCNLHRKPQVTRNFATLPAAGREIHLEYFISKFRCSQTGLNRMGQSTSVDEFSSPQ